VNAAGLPKGTFYNHFQSKELLALEILEQYSDLIHSTLSVDSKSLRSSDSENTSSVLRVLIGARSSKRLHVWKSDRRDGGNFSDSQGPSNSHPSMVRGHR